MIEDTRCLLTFMPRGLLILSVLLSVTCTDERSGGTGGVTESQGDEPAVSSLLISPDDYDFSKNPELLERIRSGPHGYFRFVSGAFSRLACTRFHGRWPSSAIVNLHGDAHLEQYAITKVGRGLTDFDKSSSGMAFLDHLRFGVSLHLACWANGWEKQEKTVVNEYFRGYYAALDDPELSPEPPPLVKRIRSTFAGNHARLLSTAEGFMTPMQITRQELEEAMLEYREQMWTLEPDLPPSFFNIIKVGQLQLGIGSALDEKYLMRVEGPTKAPEDDLILEAKEIRELEDLDCVEGSVAEPSRILIGHSRISYAPYQFAGSFSMRPRSGASLDKSFWVFAWEDDYEELSVEDSFDSLADLQSVAFDVGVQFGLGHPRGMKFPNQEVGHALARITSEMELDLHLAIEDLTSLTISSWRVFCEEFD
jgi:hypothetical protein